MCSSKETLTYRPGGGGGLVSKTLNTTQDDDKIPTFEPVIQQTKMVKNVYRQLPVIKYAINPNINKHLRQSYHQD